MFTITKHEEPFEMRRLTHPYSEPLVSTYNGVVYAIPEVLTTTPSTCANCNTLLVSPKICAGCFTVRYCDRNCQKTHWKQTHSKECCKINRSDIRDVLAVNRALSRPLSTMNDSKFFDDDQFLRALNELEDTSATLGFTAHFLIVGEISNISETRVKLTKAIEILCAQDDINIMQHTVTNDFVVWWSLSHPSISNVRIRIESNTHNGYAIVKEYAQFHIDFENMDEFRTKNKVDKKSYDDFKHLYCAMIPRLTESADDDLELQKVKNVFKGARDKNMFFRDMQVIFAIESVCQALFRKVRPNEFEMHMHLYMILSGLCKKSGDNYEACPLVQVARRLLTEINRKETEEMENIYNTSDGYDEYDNKNKPILYEELAARLKLDEKSFILFKYLYKVWVIGQ